MDYKLAWQCILEAKKILLVSHTRPDADAFGSMLALDFALKKAGKKTTLYNFTKNFAQRLKFLYGVSRIKQDINIKEYDLIISLDCGNWSRTKLEKTDCKVLNIDHHESNDFFGNINLVDFLSPSTTSIVLSFLKANDVKIYPEIATCLYAGLVEDTDFFSLGRLDEKLFSQALELVQFGADVKKVVENLRYKKSLSSVRLRKIVYEKFNLLANARIATLFISKEDFEKSGANINDTRKICNELSSLATVEFVVLVAEKDEGGFKVSLRSKNEISASDIASYFGGGGHKHAAGFEIDKKKEKKLIKNIVNLLKEKGI